MTIHIRPLCNALGAEVIGVDMCQPIDGEAFAEIYAAWLQHNILLFRGQKIDIPQQITFAARFGALELPGAAINVHPEYPEILVFSNVKVDGNNLGKLPEEAGEGWHSDHFSLAKPSKGSLFYAKEVPPEGGDTFFANQTAAYEALPEDMKKRVDGLNCTYNPFENWHYLSLNLPHQPPEVKDTVPPVSHPLIRTHPETGHKTIFVGMRGISTADHVDSLSDTESQGLLEELRAFGTQLQFVYRHHWLPGDAMLWDNRCTMHRASIFDEKLGRRHCYRVTIAGDVPR